MKRGVLAIIIRLANSFIFSELLSMYQHLCHSNDGFCLSLNSLFLAFTRRRRNFFSFLRPILLLLKE
jgi:hypothetical protein